MSIRVAIMGFGRLGRNLFRAVRFDPAIDVVCINDTAEPAALEYLLRFDSLYGPLGEPVRALDGHLYVGGRRIPLLHEAEPGRVPWYDYGVDVVVEATGRYRTRAELARHLEAGADRVILTTPPRDDLDVVHLPGVSPGPIAREHRLISCGTSTSNCLGVMLKTLEDAFGVEEAFFTSVHAYTTEQSLIDAPIGTHRENVSLRLSRAAVENIVPVDSWTEEVMPRIFPKLAGRFGGCKLNVPVPDVSCVDLVTTLGAKVGAREVNEVFRSASGSVSKGLLDYTEDPIVSSDVADSTASCTFDSLVTLAVPGGMVKTLGWYAQGGGFVHRLAEVLHQLAPR